MSNSLGAIVLRISDVISQVQLNADNHAATFDEAYDRYAYSAMRKLEDELESARKGVRFTLVFSLPVPENHSSDYQRVLKVLGMSVAAGEETITLNEHDQDRFLMDEWAWSRAFAATSVYYSGENKVHDG